MEYMTKIVKQQKNGEAKSEISPPTVAFDQWGEVK